MKIYKECLSRMNIDTFFKPVLQLLKHRYPEAQELKKPHTRFVWIARYNLVETFKQFVWLKKELANPNEYEIQIILQNKETSLTQKALLITEYVSTSKEKVVWKPDYTLLEEAKKISPKSYYSVIQTIKLQEAWGWYFICPFKKYINEFVLSELNRLYQ